MAIDLSALLSGTTTSTATVSPLVMYKKLQKLSQENAQKDPSDAAAEKAKQIARDFNNAAVRLRNTQYREQNAQIQNDATYYANRVKTATTVDELINDDRFLKVLAYGNGSEDLYLSDRQRLRDILTSDLNDPGSEARLGSLKELELAKKYNFGATGDQYDTEGNIVGINANGTLVNDGTHATVLPAGLAKLKGLAIDINGNATVVSGATDPLDNGKLIGGVNITAADANQYSKALSKTLLQEEVAPKPSSFNQKYEFDGTEYQQFIKRKDLQADIEYYKANIKDVKSLDDLFKDHRLFKFVMSTYDLESDLQYPGKVRKIIESDLGDINSLANRFQDPRYKQLAEDISFYILGVSKLTLGSTTEEMVQRYQRVEYERYLDEQAPGVRAAIEFERRIKDVSQTVQLLGDGVLREVVTVANNIPEELAYQEVDSQVTALEKRVDINALKNDRTEVEKLVMRYLTFKDSGANGAPNSYLLNLFG